MMQFAGCSLTEPFAHVLYTGFQEEEEIARYFPGPGGAISDAVRNQVRTAFELALEAFWMNRNLLRRELFLLSS